MRYPPAFGAWLLARTADEALAGDITEEYSAGHSCSWYWREVLLAALMGVMASVRQHRWRTLEATLVAWAFMTAWGLVAANEWREWHQNDQITMITRWVGYFVSGFIVGRYFRFPMIASVLLPLALGVLLRHLDLDLSWMPRPMQPPASRSVDVALCMVLGAVVGTWRTGQPRIVRHGDAIEDTRLRTPAFASHDSSH
ncbi:MAG: hypothetical protein HOP16_13825 [Acidobacteria bacterium]|nr:hypothetical protein [Acidobacteriota bacterium]